MGGKTSKPAEEITEQKESQSQTSTPNQNLISRSDTLLMQAVRKGDLNEVKALVAAGQLVNTVTPNGSALRLAVTQGRLDLVRYLVEEAKADINVTAVVPEGIDAKDVPASYQAKRLIELAIESYEHAERCYQRNKTETQLKQNRDNALGLVTYLLRHRHYPQSASLHEWLNFCAANYDVNKEIHEGINWQLFNYALSRLTGIEFRDLLDTVGKKGIDLLTVDLKNRDLHRQEVNLTTGNQQKFTLILRLRVLFEWLFQIKHQDKTYPELGISPEMILKKLEQEFLHQVEAFTLLMEMYWIEDYPEEVRSNLFAAIKSKVNDKLKTLPVNHEYTFATGWQGHAVCVNARGLTQDHIVFRVDNLLPYTCTQPNNKETVEKEVERRHQSAVEKKNDERGRENALRRVTALQTRMRESLERARFSEGHSCTLKLEDEAEGVTIPVFHIYSKVVGMVTRNSFHSNPIPDSKSPDYVDAILKTMKVTIPFQPREGAQIIYDKRLSQTAESKAYQSDLPSFEEQASGNCYLKSHEPGLYLRLGAELFKEFRYKEDMFVAGLNRHFEMIKQLSWQNFLQLENQFLLPKDLSQTLLEYYCQLSHIKRLFDPTPLPIETGSYIQLAIVKQTEKPRPSQDDKKGERREEKNQYDLRLNTYEDVVGTKQPIALEKIFDQVPNLTQRILLAGRAGIGKSTLCQYMAHQWANGKLWPNRFHALVWIKLRNLNEQCYPKREEPYTLLDIVEKECFPRPLSKLARLALAKQLNKGMERGKILWLLDGYDECIGNIPKALEAVWEELQKKSQQILTSRPHVIQGLSDYIQLEILGFDDKHVEQYVKQFFKVHSPAIQPPSANANASATAAAAASIWIPDRKGDDSKAVMSHTGIVPVTVKANTQDQALLHFIKMNPAISDIAHVPITLELICHVWESQPFAATDTLTMTALYQAILSWLLRKQILRQLIPDEKLEEKERGTQEKVIRNKPLTELEKQFSEELSFLERLAFLGMHHQQLIFDPNIIRQALPYATQKENETFFERVLNLGLIQPILSNNLSQKSSLDKEYYFIHLTFQEFFAARFLVGHLQEKPVNALRDEKDEKSVAVPNPLFRNKPEFAVSYLQQEKYNRKNWMMLGFMSGLLSKITLASHLKPLQLFWQTLQGAPRDLVGIYHLQLVIHCLNEAEGDKRLKEQQQGFEELEKWFNARRYTLSIIEILSHCSLTVKHSTLLTDLLKIFAEKNDNSTQLAARVSGKLGTAVTPEIIGALLKVLTNEKTYVGIFAAQALANLGIAAMPKVIMSKVIEALLKALTVDDNTTHDDRYIRSFAAKTLGNNLNTVVATPQVIEALLKALTDAEWNVSASAAEALGYLGVAAVTPQIIEALLKALTDYPDKDVNVSAAEALGHLGVAAVTPQVIKGLLKTLTNHEDQDVRDSVAQALSNLGAMAVTPQVIAALLKAFTDKEEYTKRSAVRILSYLGITVATPEVIEALLKMLTDKDSYLVRCSAAKALGKLGAPIATTRVIEALLKALTDNAEDVRAVAATALGHLGAAAATPQVIGAFLKALTDDKAWYVRVSAAKALSDLRVAAAMPQVIESLLAVMKTPVTDHDNGGAYVQHSAANVLAHLGAAVATPQGIEALLKALTDATWHGIRDAVAEALGDLRVAAVIPQGIEALIALTRSDAAKHNRLTTTPCYENEDDQGFEDIYNLKDSVLVKPFSAAVDSLGKLGTAVTPGVLDALVAYGYYSRTSLKKLPWWQSLSQWVQAGLQFNWANLAYPAFLQGVVITIWQHQLIIRYDKGQIILPIDNPILQRQLPAFIQALAQEAKKYALPFEHIQDQVAALLPAEDIATWTSLPPPSDQKSLHAKVAPLVVEYLNMNEANQAPSQNPYAFFVSHYQSNRSLDNKTSATITKIPFHYL